MAYYLIDYENLKTIEGFSTLTEEDTVIFFYTKNANSITFDLHREILSSRAKIEYASVAPGKNALDFQLSSYLGYLIAQYPDKTFVILSKDLGFSTLVYFWRQVVPGTEIYREDRIRERRQALVKAPDSKEAEALPAPQTPALAPTAVTPLPPPADKEEHLTKEVGDTKEIGKMKELGDTKEVSDTVPTEPSPTVPIEEAKEAPKAPIEEMVTPLDPVSDTPLDPSVTVLKESAKTPTEEAKETLFEEAPLSPQSVPSSAPSVITVEIPEEELPKPAAKAKTRTAKPKTPKAPKAEKKPKAAEPKDAADADEVRQRLKSELSLTDDEISHVFSIIDQYKSKTSINNNLSKHFKDSEKVGKMLKLAKTLLKDKT
ncbi:MAG: hypothetical protein IJW46_03595 [Clostridia bacterium]|nr:hypothetical protein [Clostridia bacterium]